MLLLRLSSNLHKTSVFVYNIINNEHIILYTLYFIYTRCFNYVCLFLKKFLRWHQQKLQE